MAPVASVVYVLTLSTVSVRLTKGTAIRWCKCKLCHIILYIKDK